MRNDILIGRTAAELMEILEREQDSNAEVTEVVVCVLVQSKPPDQPENPGYGYTIYRFSDPVRSHQAGLIEQLRDAFRNARSSGFTIVVEGEEERDVDESDPEDDPRAA